MTERTDELGAQVGSRLAARRRDRNLSGQQLAVSAGLSIDTVRSIESGRIPNPGIVTMARMAAVLEASLDESQRTRCAVPR